MAEARKIDPNWVANWYADFEESCGTVLTDEELIATGHDEKFIEFYKNLHKKCEEV